MNLILRRLALGTALFLHVLFVFVTSDQAQTTTFTYQGRIVDSIMTTGTYDLQFTLYDETSAPLGTLTRDDVPVSNGVFTVQLDFGAAFSGASRTLEIAVRRGTETGAYTTLAPRQPITSSPYAIRTASASTADTATNAAQLGGTAAANYLLKNGDGSQLTNVTAVTAGNVTGVVAVANGGTGSATQSFVDLTTAQTVGGAKTFSTTVAAPIFNAATQFNINGSRVLSSAGTNNFFAGANAGTGASNTGFSNAFVGSSAGNSNSTGNQNTFVGYAAGLNNSTGSNNTFLGTVAGQINTVGEYNTVVGSGANLNANNRVFTTLIGSNAIATGSDQIILGKVAGIYFVNGANTSRPADTVRIPGDLVVTGSIQGATKNFKIDYPLDPQNKTLTYTSVESPEMMNIYNGNTTTDANGEATVTMPEYFEALNKDFRYQLTVIGQFAQAIVSDEIRGNVFRIKTDKPHVKVSWQVTGVRHDRFAEDQNTPNVQDKPAGEKGKCLYTPLCSTTKETLPKPKP